MTADNRQQLEEKYAPGILAAAKVLFELDEERRAERTGPQGCEWGMLTPKGKQKWIIRAERVIDAYRERSGRPTAAPRPRRRATLRRAGGSSEAQIRHREGR